MLHRECKTPHKILPVNKDLVYQILDGSKFSRSVVNLPNFDSSMAGFILLRLRGMLLLFYNSG